MDYTNRIYKQIEDGKCFRCLATTKMKRGRIGVVIINLDNRTYPFIVQKERFEQMIAAKTLVEMTDPWKGPLSFINPAAAEPMWSLIRFFVTNEPACYNGPARRAFLRMLETSGYCTADFGSKLLRTYWTRGKDARGLCDMTPYGIERRRKCFPLPDNEPRHVAI